MEFGLLITFAIGAVAACAIMAYMGFKGRTDTIGVDLGTTFSVVGASVNGNIVIMEDKSGRKIFPSIVSYLDNGELRTGYDALPYLTSAPTRTIFNAKRFIGKSIDDTDVEEYAKSHPFKVVETDVSRFGKVGFSIDATGHPSVIAPEDVGTQVLKHLMSITSEFLGHSQVHKAVIAVPAKFNSKQREATGEAYKRAGLKVVRVIEEPTAAAVAYKLHKKSNIHHILVYDFGGGTLDVSLLYVSKGSVQVYATDGDDMLGGSDLDFCLYNYLKSQVENLSDRRVVENGTVDTKVPVDEQCIPSSLRNKAETLKKELSTVDSGRIDCIFAADEKMIAFNVTRKQFETTCSGLFDRALAPVTRLLSELGMAADEIDEIVLVGGTTRIPKVKNILRKYFNKELNDHIDPDITVAYGAASVLD